MKEPTQRTRAPLEKTEAIRQAIEALGHHAPVAQILEYMREQFGIGTAEAGGPVPTAEESDAPRQAVKRGKNRSNE